MNLPAHASPLFFGGKNGYILVLRIDQQDIIKALLVEPGSERQVFPPVPFTADDIGGHDFVDCPQAFIISQRYHSSFLKWIKLG